MFRKLQIIFTIVVLLVVCTTPALAKKPPEAEVKGNSTHQDNGNGNDTVHNNGRKPATSDTPNSNRSTSRDRELYTTNHNTGHGFDDSGYNRTARIFNGTVWEWCMEKVGDEDWCLANYGDYANDRLIMKWNAEWDRGNDEGWTDTHYDAWLNNLFNGKVPGGSGEVWHYKIVWVGPCTEGEVFSNGGYCIWGQFEVLMDQGTADGVHEWLAHARPTGYGSYP